MRRFAHFIATAYMRGLLIALPVYLAILLILRGVKSLAGLVRPLAFLRPPGMSSDAAATVIALIILSTVCVALGIGVLTRTGRAAREGIERAVLRKIPGYTLVKDLTQQLAGDGRETAWKPALAEMANGLVFSFIIEELPDGRYVVFVPRVPSPVAGSVYILSHERIHPLNASFAHVFQTLTRWGSGAGEMAAGIYSGARKSKSSTSTERTKIA